MLPFRSVQDAVGESAVADFLAYDTAGIPLAMRLTTVLESTSATSTVYRWFADCSDASPASGAEISVGTGLITFDSRGRYVSYTNSTVSIPRGDVAAVSPLEFDLDFSRLSGRSSDNSRLVVSRQDGSGMGTLTSFSPGEDGLFRGVFSSGINRILGQVRLARFDDVDALESVGENLFTPTVESGPPITGSPRTAGFGHIELSPPDPPEQTDVAGDANGDGVVDIIDFKIWDICKFTRGTDWTLGDFNNDNVTDVRDFMIWNAHKFTSMPAAAPVHAAVLKEITASEPSESQLSTSELLDLSEVIAAAPTSAQEDSPSQQAVDRLLATYWM